MSNRNSSNHDTFNGGDSTVAVDSFDSLDLTEFESDQFDPIEWLNSRLPSECRSAASDPPILSQLSSLLNSLQRSMMEIEAKTDRLNDELFDGLQNSDAELKAIETEAALAKQQIDFAIKKMPSLEFKSAESEDSEPAPVVKLVELSRSQAEVSSARSRLQQSAFWFGRTRSVESAISNREFSSALSEEFESLKSGISSSAGESKELIAERTTEFHRLQSLAIAAAEPEIRLLFNKHVDKNDLNATTRSIKAFSQLFLTLKNFPLFQELFVRGRTSVVKQMFQQAAEISKSAPAAANANNSSKPTSAQVDHFSRLLDWIPLLFDRIAQFYSSEVNWIMVVFDDSAASERSAMLLELLTAVSSEFANYFSDWISSFLSSNLPQPSSSLTILHEISVNFLYRIYSLSQPIQRTHFHTLVAVIHKPFRSHYANYGNLEYPFFFNQLNSIQLNSWNQLSSIPSSFLSKSLFDSTSRCISYSHSICWPGFISAAEKFIEEFILRINKLLKEFKLKQLKEFKHSNSINKKSKRAATASSSSASAATAAAAVELDLESELASDSVGSDFSSFTTESIGDGNQGLLTANFRFLDQIKRWKRDLQQANHSIAGILKAAATEIVSEYDAEQREIAESDKSKSRAHTANHPTFTNSDAFSVKLIFVPLIRDHSQRRQTVERLLQLNSNEIIFPIAMEKLSNFIADYCEFMLEIMFFPIESKLKSYANKSAWTAQISQAASIMQLPLFSQQPSESINEICDYLMNLVSRLQNEPALNEAAEPQTDSAAAAADSRLESSGNIDYWIEKVLNRVGTELSNQLESITMISDKGAKQLETDLDRIRPVMQALGGSAADQRMEAARKIIQVNNFEQADAMIKNFLTDQEKRIATAIIKARRAAAAAEQMNQK